MILKDQRHTESVHKSGSFINALVMSVMRCTADFVHDSVYMRLLARGPLVVRQVQVSI